VIAVSGLMAAGLVPVTMAAAAPAAPVVAASQPAPGSYIVLLKGGDGRVSAASVMASAASVASSAGVKAIHTYTATIHGFSVKTDATGAAKIAADPRVQAVYQDGLAKVDASEVVPPAPNTFWGIDAIDSRSAVVTDGRYNYAYTGSGVRVYDIDTGILSTHSQFAGRVLPGATAINDGYGTYDCNGHGTHTAGIIGGTTYGVAKMVKIVPVRVFDCTGSGTWSNVIAGVDWVTAQKLKYPSVPMAANMSLGGSWYMLADLAVNDSIEAGVTYSISAGNSYGADACNVSPADVLSAITVGATGNWEAPYAPASRVKSTYSNSGPCLDVWAPGSNILSAYNTGNNAAAVMSGTSMAAPHVTGVAALYLQSRPNANPMEVRNYIVSLSTKNVVGGLDPTTPNRFLWEGGPSKLTMTAPSHVKKGASFTVSGTLAAGGMPLVASVVKIYFQAGTAAALLKGTVATNGSGKYTLSSSETTAGTWRVVYGGAPLIGASSASAPVPIG
jgi:subtilisin family serine protease